MTAYREPPGLPPVDPPPVDGEGVEDGAPDGDGVGRVDGDEDGVAGGVIDGLAGVGMVPETDAGMMPYRPCLSRILCVPSRAGTSVWWPGFGAVRPIWTIQRLRYHGMVTWRWWLPIAHGDVPLDRSPIVDARVLTLSLDTPDDRYWYSHLRGTMARCLPRGVRLTAMVRWGPPNGERPHRRAHSHGATQWCRRWTPRVMGALWIWPDLQAHGRWGLSAGHYLDSYQSWFDPIVGYDSGLVLDTRMLALQGHTIPLPPAMVDAYRPHVRLLSLADIPTEVQRRRAGIPRTARPWLDAQPWLPGSTRRYSLARWRAFCDQFPDVPVTLPALTPHMPPPSWLGDALQARPSVQPMATVWPPPAMRQCSLTQPHATSKAQRNRETRRTLASHGATRPPRPHPA